MIVAAPESGLDAGAQRFTAPRPVGLAGAVGRFGAVAHTLDERPDDEGQADRDQPHTCDRGAGTPEADEGQPRHHHREADGEDEEELVHGGSLLGRASRWAT